MPVWCALDSSGHATQIFFEDLGSPDLTELELPEGVDAMQLGDWAWDGSSWTRDGAASAAAEEAGRAARTEALRRSQLASVATAYVRAESSAGRLDRRAAVGYSTLLEEWSGDGVRYFAGGWLSYGGDVYRVEITHDSQPDWTPDAAPSLFTRIRLAPDGVRVWELPTHAENAFDLGERAHYPDEGGAIWVSGRDGNVSEPGTDRWWTRDGDGGSGGTDPEPEEPEPPTAEPYDPQHRYSSGETCLWEGRVYVWDADGSIGVPGVWSPADYPQGWTEVA